MDDLYKSRYIHSLPELDPDTAGFPKPVYFASLRESLRSL
jgi:hypothetical protein